MFSQMNHRRRLIWCKEMIRTFVTNVPCSLSNATDCFLKKLEKTKGQAPIKLHIWGGISIRGVTKLVMFTGIMDANHLGAIYEAGLLPFVNERFPEGNRQSSEPCQ